ncbi:MAG TPA: universal stress protein [Stellaceae bacterium]|nr:universal stress protein [Stellaceae bacterium]
MAFKDILVLLDNHPGYESRLEVALSLARQSDARLVALYGFELPHTRSPALCLADAIYAPSDASHTMYERERDAAFDSAANLEATFRTATRRAGIAGSWEIWPENPKDLIGLVTTRARYADLAVLGQADPDHPLFDTLAKLPEMVMLGSGRPVMVVPYAGQPRVVGRRVMIAWNGGREAARAVADALPLLKPAEAVTVLSVSDKGGDETCDEAARRLAAHLAQHGIRATAEQFAAMGMEVGDIILSRVADLGCDLVVMGGYEHSRTRELILGGATRGVLQQMTVPVLMSH